MAKLTLSPISSFTQSAVTTINANMDAIEAAVENTLSRDGTIPNQMTADLDMNNNDILNVDNIDANVIVLDGQVLIPQEIMAGTAQGILDAIKTVDGTGSGLDADLLDGLHSTAFVKYTDTSTATMQFVVDEDDMTSNIATKVPTQQSTKAYIDKNAISVLNFIPVALWPSILDRTIVTDLSTYLQNALNACGVAGSILLFPAGRYPHATGLVYGPQTTSFTPTGNDTTSDIHFMQVQSSRIIGVGFAELYALGPMTAQLKVTYQNSRQAPHGTRVEGIFFNGRSLAERGIQSLWTFNSEYVNNRFDAHTIVNFEHEGRAHLDVRHNIFRGQKNVLVRLGGDNNFSNNDFYPQGGGASAVRRGIEFGPSSGNTVVDKTNVFTMEIAHAADNNNTVAIYIDGLTTYMSTTGNRDIQIDGCEFHGFEHGVLAEGSSGANLKNIDIINCHSFTGSYSKTCLAKIDTARSVTISGCRSNTIGTTRSTLPGIILDAVENVEVSGNDIGGVTGVEAIRVEGNSIDVAVHDNHFREAVNTAHPYIKVDSSSLVTITDNYAQQYSAFTTKFIQELGSGSGNVFGDNYLSASFTDIVDTANTNTTYKGKDYSASTQATVAAGSTVYLGENGTQTSEFFTAWTNPSRPKYAKRLVITTNAAPGAGQTFTYTLNVDGVDTALTAQTTGAGVFTAVDFSNEALIALGSRFAVKLVTSAGAAVTAHRVAFTLV